MSNDSKKKQTKKNKENISVLASSGKYIDIFSPPSVLQSRTVLFATFMLLGEIFVVKQWLFCCCCCCLQEIFSFIFNLPPLIVIRISRLPYSYSTLICLTMLKSVSRTR